MYTQRKMSNILHYNVHINYYIPLVLPKARRTKADSFKFLSSTRLSARTLRVKLQKMRPPLKDELISWNPLCGPGRAVSSTGIHVLFFLQYILACILSSTTLTVSRVFPLGAWFCGLYVSSAYTASFVASLWHANTSSMPFPPITLVCWHSNCHPSWSRCL